MIKYFDYVKNLNEEYRERLELVSGRLEEISVNPEIKAPYDGYFRETACFLLELKALADGVEKDPGFTAGSRGEALNRKLFADRLKKEAYDKSFLNPTYAAGMLGKEEGPALAAVYAGLRRELPRIYAGNISMLCLYAELLVELHVIMSEEDYSFKEAKEAISSFYHDNLEFMTEQDTFHHFDERSDFALGILEEADLSNSDFLYRYGCYIGPNETGIFDFLNTLPEADLKAMADTYTEGFRIGFQTCNKPLEKKTFCDVRYPIGFERMMRPALKNFEKMGLAVHAMPFSTDPGKQCTNDHEKDLALWLDKSFVERSAESLKKSLEVYRDRCPEYAGPAVIECWGETPFEPESREANLKLDKKQQEYYVSMVSQRSRLINEYIHGDERSFTIISYPIPEIGDRFAEIFAETVKVNTLDYILYQTMQQKLIDVLDTADHVHVVGKGANKTDIRVKVHELKDPAKETAFENCVADVNIPVGEVFTSPVLEGTDGKLHVTQVYLEGRNFLDLELDFKDGCVTAYSCKNFEKEADNKSYIEDHILFNHPTLPMGEFAIGTNTTAYRMGIEYGIQEKLPILIAEKTGPHFAVGDTCYSYDEDTETFNPDGKAIVARENSFSALRKTQPEKAYFNCHTDITIPYNELKSIVAVAKDGSEIPIILDGKFVVPGTEALNEPLEGLL